MLSYVNNNDYFAIIKFDITFIIYEPRRDMAGIENNFLKLNSLQSTQTNSSKSAAKSGSVNADNRMSKDGSIFSRGGGDFLFK